jgi:uncharacterized protein with PIN domain
MTCPNCNQKMKEVETIIRTTSPEKEDVFEKVLMCPKCEHFEPIISLEEDYEQN